MDELLKQLTAYARGVWRRRWIGLAAAWSVALIATVVVYRMPDKFEATARVYVDTDSVLKPLLAGLAVQPNINQQIALLSRTLVSRPNMEKLIRATDMDLKVRTAQEKDELIDQLSKSIKIASAGEEGPGGRNNLFSISFMSSQPTEAKRVVQSLVDIFMDSGIGRKRKDTENAQRFIEDQIKIYERKLEEAENRLKEFKLKNLNLMGPDGKDYLGKMTALADEASKAHLELRAAEQSRDALKRELAGEDPVLLPSTPALLPPTTTEIDGRLQNLKRNLDELLRKYTEEHPDVVGTRRIIEQLEVQRKAELETRAKAMPKQSTSSSSSNPVFQQLRISLAESEARVASLRSRSSELEGRLAQLRAAARMQPQIETEFAQLNREYEIQKRQFETLVGRRETASISGQMDATTGVADFRVIDPPRVSQNPVSPNRLLLVPLALLTALAAGIAVSFLVSQVYPTFYDAGALREFTGRAVLGAVSLIRNDGLIRQRRRGNILFVCGVAGLIMIYGAWLFWLSLAARLAGGQL